jgi:acetyltransferase
MSMGKLEVLFNPKTIAVIGANSDKKSVGYSIFSNLIGSGYEGIVYPVNMKRTSVQGVKSYPSVSSVPDKVDLAIIATPAAGVPALLEECGMAGVSGVVIVSSGFKEAGKEGTDLYNLISATAAKYGIRVMGPNCLGFIKPSINLNASFAGKMPLRGKIAFISQSGALCTSVLDWAVKQNVGFSHFVSIGEMVDIGFHDLIDYFGTDPGTNSILIYMESLSDARRFLSAARAFSRTKPIIILKAGKTAGGASAALSHTGSLAGDDRVFDAAFKRAGVIRVNEIGELFDSAKTLSMQRMPHGNRLAIVTNAGGPGVIAADYLLTNNGQLATLSEDTFAKLNKALPAAWSRSNPVDVLGDANPQRYKDAAGLCLNDEGADGVLVILTPQGVTESSAIAKEIVSLPRYKTILTSWMGEDAVKEGREILEKGNIPTYRTPEDAERCFMSMYQYSRNLELLYETPATIPSKFVPKTKENRKLITEIMRSGRCVLTEDESKQVLANYDIPIAKNFVVKTATEAVKAASEVGYPVVMKIVSQDIIHKTDVGGVKLKVNCDEDAKNAFNEIITSVKEKKPDARIEGILVEAMQQKRYELLIGSKKDPIFGPVIVFGMGGVAVEVFKDTNVGLPPLNMALAMRLIEDTKIFKLLKGYRGMKGVDISAIQFLLYKFAYLVMDFPEIKEVDINPFAVDENGGVVLDAKILLDEGLIGKSVKPYSHMVISPYPKEYITSFTMKDGTQVTLRPIRPEDEPIESEMIKGLTERTSRLRFFQPLKDITHELMIRYTQIDYDREMAIIAELNENGKEKMAGVVRLIADPYNDSAEFAILVADEYQNKGLGNKLTDYVFDIARKKGVRRIYAEIMTENYAMIHILKKRGFDMSQSNETCHAEKILKSDCHGEKVTKSKN